ncbi:translation initiation factor IF-2-like [Cervus elaphus]|uniref:translation initiation factor IF-2-like n=1 Tax=Cervus elaphus TaxID=9860 RepID=UPI001CC3239F|nr:translation initiation factor IF-2-like [Cervus elaphus]
MRPHGPRALLRNKENPELERIPGLCCRPQAALRPRCCPSVPQGPARPPPREELSARSLHISNTPPARHARTAPPPPPPRSPLLCPPIPRPTWRSVRPQRGPRPCLAPRARPSGGREPNADGSAVPDAPRASLDRGGPGTLDRPSLPPASKSPGAALPGPEGAADPGEVTPKSPRLGSPARPPPGQGGGAYPAFGPPRLQFAAPASGSGCGSRAPWPSAGRRGPRGRPAAERPAGRGILAAAARGWRVPLNSTPPPLPPSLPPLAPPPPPPRPCSDPAAWLAAPRRPGAGGGAGRMPPRAPPRRPSDRPAPDSRRRGPLSLSVGPRVCGSSVSHRRGRALRMRASRPKPPREGGVSGEAWAILASCCRLGSVHTLDAGHGLPAAWGLGAGMDSGNLGPGVEGSGTASQRKPDLR